MSLGYADRLSYREDLGGTLGAPELHDSDEDVVRKVAVLTGYVRAILLVLKRLPNLRTFPLQPHSLCGV